MSDLVQNFNNLSYSKDNLPNGKIQLKIEVADERFEREKNITLERLAPTVKISGFRPGKAPRNITAAYLGPTLFEETLGKLIPECTLEIIKKENLLPLDQIAYNVEKIAEGSGVSYTATFSVFPEFSLPSFKKIKVKKNKIEVNETEIEKVIQQMFSEKKTAGEKEEKDIKKEKKISDAWAASLNFNVKNLKELREKVNAELFKQKEEMEKNRFISEVMSQVIKESKFDVPKVLIDQEVEKKEKAYRKRIEDLGMKVDDFLRNQKTSMEELHKEWKPEAEDKLKSEIILIKVTRDFGINVDEKEVEAQVNAIKDETLRSQYQSLDAQNYLRTILLQQKALQKILELVS